MKKTNLQFYATQEELESILFDMVCNEELFVFLIRFFPEYEAYIVTKNQKPQISDWRMAIISEHNHKMSTSEEYATYSATIHGDMIMIIGNETETELIESSLGVVAEKTISPRWIKFLNKLRKQFLKGAYVVSPQGSRCYYPDIMFSIGAKKAYNEGKIIRPIAGWNYLEFASE